MRKFLKKIICIFAAAAMGASLVTATACSNVYKGKKLEGNVEGTVVSNGGFAVQKGDFVYYINGKQVNTADNTLGKVQTGAIMRISKSDLEKGNYADTETVVPEIVYSGNNDAGIFIYGDSVYYSTPSSEKNSDGEILNSELVFKSAKLDGSAVKKDYYAKYTDNTIQYRYVEADGVVYLLYVATSEDLYGKSCTNIHSVNTQTGVDTLLAYNVNSVMFDKVDLTNPRVYYTMQVTDYTTSTSPNTKYNQVYTVTADETERNEYDFSFISDYDAEKDPLYINCGDLVLDGIGKIDANLMPEQILTQFNAPELIDEGVLATLTRSAYTYTLSSYQHGTLFYTRTSTNNKTASLFAVKESTLLAANHKPAIDNPEDYILVDGASASTYTYMFDNSDNLTGAFVANSNGILKAALKDGKLLTDVDNENTFYITTSGTPTILFTGTHKEGGKEYKDVYYSESGNGANGYIIKRISYDGTYDDYNKMHENDDVNAYSAVRILDLDCSSDWYKPEIFDGRIFFSTQTKNMTEYSSGTARYSHVMVCDINGADGIMTSAELDALNEKYKGITDKIGEVDESTYENLQNAYRYAFYTGDSEYIDVIIKAYVDTGEDEEKFWSKESVEKFKDFVTASGDWEEYAEDTRTVNGVVLHANMHDYYYALLGKMTAEDEADYTDYLRTTYLKALPETEETWFEGLSAGAKAGFLIGVIGGGLIVIAAGVVVALVIVRKRTSKMPAYTKKRIKVDTTDDKSVDVYSSEDGEGADEE